MASPFRNAVSVMRAISCLVSELFVMKKDLSGDPDLETARDKRPVIISL
jgi:hypothetical protein